MGAIMVTLVLLGVGRRIILLFLLSLAMFMWLLARESTLSEDVFASEKLHTISSTYNKVKRNRLIILG